MRKEKGVFLGVCISLCLLFSAMLALAIEYEATMKVGDGVFVGGKNITLRSVGTGKATMIVDGKFGAIEKNINKTINGVDLLLKVSSVQAGIAIIYINVPFLCGDENCGENEDNKICCTDCGCLNKEHVCISNQCLPDIVTTENQCNFDNECGTSTGCTKYICDKSIYPAKCKTKKITTCESDDLCCPLGCTNATDADCSTIGQCVTEGDCPTSNPCVSSACQGSPGQCVFTENAGCVSVDECKEVGTVQNGVFCSTASVWSPQRSIFVSCTQSYECGSGLCVDNECTDQEEQQKNKYRFIMYLVYGLLIFILLFYTIAAINHKRRVNQSRQQL